MKNRRGLLALMLAVVMVLAMGMTVFGEPAKEDLSVKDPVPGHTYTAYQLFVGDLATDEEEKQTLSNVKWGSAVKSEITVNGSVYHPVENEAVPQEVLDYLASLGSKSADDPAQETADIISALIDTSKTGITLSDTAVQVDTGYYVVIDQYVNPAAEQTTTLSTIICEVVGPTEVAPKAGTTEHKKEVLDINDTTDVALDLDDLEGIDEDSWDKSADHDFGDHVPFKLTTTIASDFAKYDSYYLAINDNLMNGLTLDLDSIRVYVDGELADEGGADDPGSYFLDQHEKGFEVIFYELNGNEHAAAGKEVVVYYTATLDPETAVIGNPGNWNESYAEFSNNPNGDQEGYGRTPKDTAVVFTYKTVVNKVEPDGDTTKPLAGAEFTLEKKLQDGSIKTIAVIKYDENGNVTTNTADGTAASEGDATKFSFNGLDDGTYILKETVTPIGYNTIDPITFVILATHEADKENGITQLTVTHEDGTEFDGELEFTITKKEGSISTDILNQKGSVLPSTGGIGTTIFYVVGGVLVVLAVVFLALRRRNSGKAE